MDYNHGVRKIEIECVLLKSIRTSNATGLKRSDINISSLVSVWGRFALLK